MTMRLGIDASNIRASGGLTHLAALLRAADPTRFGFEQVVVWGNRRTLGEIVDRPWLLKQHELSLDGAILRRLYWQRFCLSKRALNTRCDLIFVPGGSYSGSFRPIITMSQNLLPFEPDERGRFGLSYTRARLSLLRVTQSRTFDSADGVVFLTEYAQSVVTKAIGHPLASTKVIPHGIDACFFAAPRQQLPVPIIGSSKPYRIIYVSIVNTYKHQWNVAEAVAALRKRGLDVTLDFVGPAYAPALRRLNITLDRIDPRRTFVRYLGEVPHTDLPQYYAQSDMCLFASSCENLPIILLEGMASGLPIACSDRGPMPEVLGDCGVYFDPERVDQMTEVLEKFLKSPSSRQESANGAFERAQKYSWATCAEATFQYFREVVHDSPRNQSFAQ